VAVVQRQGGSWRAVLVGLGLFGTDLGTHDSVEMAMQVAGPVGRTGMRRLRCVVRPAVRGR